MAPATKTGTFLMVSCLAIAAAMLALAGCAANSGEKPGLPDPTDTTILIPHGTVSPTKTVGLTGQNLNLTIHSAQKVTRLQGRSPENGVWVVVDLSIKNRGFPEGISLKQDEIVLTDPETGRSFSPSHDDMHLADPWTDGDLAFNTTKREEILFVTNVSSDSFVLTIHDTSGRPLSQAFVNSTRNREYSHALSDTTKSLVNCRNFTAVVEQLTTPEKTLEYMGDTFIFTNHEPGLTSYTPEDFFRIKKGDCKDYATFFSYVIAQHGYYAEIVSVKYSHIGHVVTIFRDDDGQMKYQSSDKMNGFRNVSSLDDLLLQEKTRLHEGIVRYKVLPPGSVNMCTTESGIC